MELFEIYASNSVGKAWFSNCTKVFALKPAKAVGSVKKTVWCQTLAISGLRNVAVKAALMQCIITCGIQNENNQMHIQNHIMSGNSRMKCLEATVHVVDWCHCPGCLKKQNDNIYKILPTQLPQKLSKQIFCFWPKSIAGLSFLVTLQLPHLAFMPLHAPWISGANQRWRKERFLLLADCGCHRKRSTEFSKYFAKFPGSIGLKHRGMCSWTIPEALWTPKPWNLAPSQVLPFHEILRSITKHIPRPNSVQNEGELNDWFPNLTVLWVEVRLILFLQGVDCTFQEPMLLSGYCNGNKPTSEHPSTQKKNHLEQHLPEDHLEYFNFK